MVRTLFPQYIARSLHSYAKHVALSGQMVCMLFPIFPECIGVVIALQNFCETRCTNWPGGLHCVSLVYCNVIALQNSWETGCIEWLNGTSRCIAWPLHCTSYEKHVAVSDRLVGTVFLNCIATCTKWLDALHTISFVYCLVIALKHS